MNETTEARSQILPDFPPLADHFLQKDKRELIGV